MPFPMISYSNHPSTWPMIYFLIRFKLISTIAEVIVTVYDAKVSVLLHHQFALSDKYEKATIREVLGKVKNHHADYQEKMMNC